MSYLFRRLCTRKAFQLILDNTIKKPLHGNSFILPAVTTFHNQDYQNLIVRYKSKDSKSKFSRNAAASESEEEDKEEDLFDIIKDKHTKTMNVSVPSLRVDALLKTGLGLSRNRIETLFYSSNIRVNGEKLLKKSTSVYEGDEIDVVKGVSPTNPNFLIVARIEIVEVKGEDESINVKLRRCKALTIENYPGRNKWSASSQS
ncbi:unnamed protein product [Phyllotreta striolata]|uniref:Mitochondrial transcription rescue factor 1 C-terminal domain-containing protein n=1 Tax=Phyllotreta striolata TaxID=444603 RepID=A0A9N9TS72_PHYSR|nr:unnamed protein product [Phyllotreta striolata]